MSAKIESQITISAFPKSDKVVIPCFSSQNPLPESKLPRRLSHQLVLRAKPGDDEEISAVTDERDVVKDEDVGIDAQGCHPR